jgi:hypothetical protein
VDSTAIRPQRIALALNSLFVSVQEQRGIWKATFRAKLSSPSPWRIS